MEMHRYFPVRFLMMYGGLLIGINWSVLLLMPFKFSLNVASEKKMKYNYSQIQNKIKEKIEKEGTATILNECWLHFLYGLDHCLCCKKNASMRCSEHCGNTVRDK